jgi:hypothetical protein
MSYARRIGVQLWMRSHGVTPALCSIAGRGVLPHTKNMASLWRHVLPSTHIKAATVANWRIFQVPITPNVYAVSMLVGASRHRPWWDTESSHVLYKAVFAIIDELEGDELLAARAAIELNTFKLSFWI